MTERPRPVLSACAAWCGLAPLSVALSLLAPRGVLRDLSAPAWARLTLAAAELAALAALVLLMSLAIGAVPARRSLALRALRSAALALLLFGYAASWGMFCTTGQFLDAEALVFLAGDLRSVLGYVSGMLALPLAAAVAASLGLAFAAGEILPRWIRARRPESVRRFTVAVGVLVAACALLGLGGEIARADEHYGFRRSYAAGPSLRLFSCFVEHPSGPEREGPPGPEPRVVHRPREVEPPAGKPARPLNVIVVLVDSLRADQLGRGVMPALDALSGESRVFTDCLTTASHTDYAAPSALSSHYPLRSPCTHRYPDRPAYPRVFIYDVLKPLGYRTALFSSQDDDWRRMSRHLRTEGLDHAFDAKSAEDRHPEGTLDDAVTISAAIRWIDAGEGPFFLALNLQNAHAPYRVPAEFPRRFGPRERDFPLSFGWFPREKEHLVRGVYADSLSYIDAQLDRLFARLRERGLWEETIVAVTADHGEAFYEHGFAAHGGPLFDEVARVPLVLRVPGGPRGEDARPAQILDLPPTILGAIGIAPHPSFQGIDLFESNPRPDRPRFMVAQTPTTHHFVVVRSGHKLVYDAQFRRYSLFDLSADPGERRDISEDSPARTRELRHLLAAWYEAQVEYYRDPARHLRFYPPVFAGE